MTKPNEVYSVDEVAQAAGVPVSSVQALVAAGRIHAVSPVHPFFHPNQAVIAVRTLRSTGTHNTGFLFDQPIFARASARIPVAVSSTVHAGIVAFIVFLTTFNLAPRAAVLKSEDRVDDPMRLVFVATPGPGGGGGGGGLLQKAPPPKALRKGTHTISSPLPVRNEPKPIEPVPAPPEPKPEPPLQAEQLPAVVAPIVTAPADNRDR